MTLRKILFTLSLCLAIVGGAGCQTAYYSVMEQFGKEKRHLLKSEVKKVQSDQKAASNQFEKTLETIKKMTGFDGGDLERKYKALKSDYEECEDRAENVNERIDNVQQIANDLFTEWEKEIQEISNANLKSKSRASLAETKERFAKLNTAMVNAENSMKPVLGNLNDHVLYLKHNLNAQAIGALKQEVDNIRVEVASLIEDINKSVKEADDFLKTFK